MAAGLPYDILVYARQLPEAVAFAADFPNGRFVLDHLGKPDIRAGAFDAWYANAQQMAALPHVVAKLSGLVTEAHWHEWTPSELGRYVDAAFDCFGADRLMIGSDWPVCTLSAQLSSDDGRRVGQRSSGGPQRSARPSWVALLSDSGI